MSKARLDTILSELRAGKCPIIADCRGTGVLMKIEDNIAGDEDLWREYSEELVREINKRWDLYSLMKKAVTTIKMASILEAIGTDEDVIREIHKRRDEYPKLVKAVEILRTVLETVIKNHSLLREHRQGTTCGICIDALDAVDALIMDERKDVSDG